ncbi:MAG: hypothetical protein J6S42_03370 [Thermoguttaceae bacterium]|nr:hypothetical protein [Thermoguttaceae bacterium]
MSCFSLILGLWPGLSGLVRYGRGVFLILAAGFGLLASGTLFCCGYWSELIAPESKIWLAGGVLAAHLVLSLVSAALSTLFSGQLAYDEEGDRYLMALEAYLSGNWNETERIARAILRRNRRDPDTILLLATLCRHTERYAEAAAWLDRLEALETAEKWAEEIAFERAELAEAAAGEEEEDAPPEVIPLPAREEEKRVPAERRRAVGR